MKKTVLVFLVFCGIVCCHPNRGPDGVRAGVHTCADACSNARKLCGPEELKPARAGTCEDVCRNTVQNGVDFRVDCLATAPSCDDVRSCEN